MHICKSRLMPLYLSYWIILDTTPTLWVPEFFPPSFKGGGERSSSIGHSKYLHVIIHRVGSDSPTGRLRLFQE